MRPMEAFSFVEGPFEENVIRKTFQMPKFRTLLKNKNFVLYSIGQAFSQFGDRLVQILLIGLVYKRYPGSSLQLAKLFCFTVLPSFFLSPVAGVYIDRWNKKYVMMISDIFRAVAILLVPVIFIYRESIVPIYAIIFFVFAAACFFLPARLAVIPGLVPKENLLLANSASSITWVIAGITGFSLGGVLAEWIGIKNGLYLNALVYFLSAASFLMLAFSVKKRTQDAPGPREPVDVTKILKKSFLDDFKEGLKVLFLDKKIRFVAFTFFLFSSMIGALYVVGVVFIQDVMRSMTKDIGIFAMFLFIGLLVGSYMYGKTGKKFHRTKTVFASVFLTGLSIDAFVVGLKAMQSFWFGNAAMFCLGLFISPVYVTANTIIHETIESRLGGRVFSSIGIIINIGFLSFMFISSTLAEYVGRFWVLVFCGTLFSIFGIVNLIAEFLKKENTTFS